MKNNEQHINFTEIQKILKKSKPFLQSRFRVKELAVFGSYLRGTQKKGSDLDLLVEFTEPISLFEFIGLRDFLTDTIGVKVDLVMRDTLKSGIKEQITKEAIPM